MRKIVVLALFSMLLCFVAVPSSADPGSGHETPSTEPDVIGNPLLEGMSAHRIYSSVKVEMAGHGTGTVLNSMFILTAYHVVNGPRPVTVTLPYDDRPIPAKVEVYGNLEDLDYAVLRLDMTAGRTERDGVILPLGLQANPITVKYFLPSYPFEDYSALSTGTHAFVAGYPLDFPLHLTEGVICSQSDGYITTSIPITSGNSGSGVVVKRDGEEMIAGVMVRVAMGRGTGQVYHISLMTRWDKIYADLKEKDCLYVLTGEDVPDAPRDPLEEEIPPPEPFGAPDDPFGSPFGPGPWGPDGRRRHQNDSYRYFNPKRPTLRIEDMNNPEVLRVLNDRIAMGH